MEFCHLHVTSWVAYVTFPINIPDPANKILGFILAHLGSSTFPHPLGYHGKGPVLPGTGVYSSRDHSHSPAYTSQPFFPGPDSVDSPERRQAPGQVRSAENGL